MLATSFRPAWRFTVSHVTKSTAVIKKSTSTNVRSSNSDRSWLATVSRKQDGSSSERSYRRSSTSAEKRSSRDSSSLLLFGLGAGALLLTLVLSDDESEGAERSSKTETPKDAKTSAAKGDKKAVEEKRLLFPQNLDSTRHKVVILGSGWGAMALIKNLDPTYYDVYVVSPRNYFLFTPLLPGSATGTVEHRSIIEPIHRILRRRPHMSYFEASCTDIDPESKTLVCKDTSGFCGDNSEFMLKYDTLVVAVGAVNNTFGTEGVRENCFFLKEIPDSVKIRKRLVDCFETANFPGTSEQEKRRLLSFLIVGGGPTGVEFAAELSDMVQSDAKKWFPNLLPYVSVNVVQSADHILNTFDEQISKYAEDKFKREAINVLVNTRVLKVEPGKVQIFDKNAKKNLEMPYGLCVWSTGIAPAPLTVELCKKLKTQSNQKALITDERLRVKGADGIYAIGDCSTVDQKKLLENMISIFKEANIDEEGGLTFDEFNGVVQRYTKQYPQLTEYTKRLDRLFKQYDVNNDNKLSTSEFKQFLLMADSNLKSLPATAQVASQEGEYLARTFNKLGAQPTIKPTEVEPFTYRHMGSLAYVGDHEAVGQIMGRNALGLGTWFLWRGIYLSRQVSIRNQALISFDWVKCALFGRDSSRF